LLLRLHHIKIYFAVIKSNPQYILFSSSWFEMPTQCNECWYFQMFCQQCKQPNGYTSTFIYSNKFDIHRTVHRDILLQ